MNVLKNTTILLFLLLLISGHSAIAQKKRYIPILPIEQNINTILINYVNGVEYSRLTGHYRKDSTFLDSIKIDSENKIVQIYFDVRFSYAPFRENTLQKLTSILLEGIEKEYNTHEIQFYSDGKNVNVYIPNFYRTDSVAHDTLRTLLKLQRDAKPLVTNISNPDTVKTNLYNVNIALWNSHGWYYDNLLNRWEWQRARLFGTVEDLFPTTYVLNYLLPMLENAGAQVFVPRERSWQTHEVIVDNDVSNLNCIFKRNVHIVRTDTGFAITNTLITNENPFKMGTSFQFEAQLNGKKTVEWIPDIPESGEYPVYISYKDSNQNSDSAHYKVYHTGGVTEFLVNQQIGGGTWVYLGSFNFERGLNDELGKVVLLNAGNPDDLISADAVRFGGGMGNISRNGLKSKRPRYQEAARYYLQYAGFPDTLVWKLNVDNDYADDRQARGAWVNYLMRPTTVLEGDTLVRGLGIPIDLTLAFHTDAGIAGSDSIVGTLGIFSTKEDTNIFPSGLSKMASRDMTDIIQTQIVDDIRAKYDSNWVRRDMWDKAYTEAVRPKTPTMMLELLSHQNFMDVRFGKEPVFQFDVSRAIYKGMLKFLNTLYGIPYVVQPLPVTHFQVLLTKNGGIELKWQAQPDSLEPTANAEAYIVYMRKNNGGFDNGMLVNTNKIILNEVDKDIIYSFKVSAVNRGGESFPSEELSGCNVSKAKGTVLILNSFDRVGSSAWFNDSTAGGFLNQVDEGVPYMHDFHTTGSQFDFNKNSPWLDDDSPGFGASTADMEDKIIPGNTFNFAYMHGQSIKNAGYSFVSVSDEAIESGGVNLTNYKIVDFLAGEEKTSFLPKNDTVAHYQIFTKNMVSALKKYLNNGGNLFISGAHIASDIKLNDQEIEMGELLKYKWITSNASKKGEFYFMNPNFSDSEIAFQFNSGYHPDIYTVEGADAFIPFGSNSTTLLRYTENNMSAGIMHKGTYKIVAFGFPFESIITSYERDLIMAKILRFLNEK